MDNKNTTINIIGLVLLFAVVAVSITLNVIQAAALDQVVQIRDTNKIQDEKIGQLQLDSVEWRTMLLERLDALKAVVEEIKNEVKR